MNTSEFKEIDKYISDLFSNQDDNLLSTISSLDDSGMPQHSIFPNQGRLLQIFISMCNAKKVLEIGTLGGYSTIWLARALPEEGSVITIELEPSYAKVAQNNIEKTGLEDKVTIRVGEALSVLEDLDKEEVGKFDLFFIDAHKPSYIKYLEWALLHSHKGTFMVFDNVIRNGEVLNNSSTDEKVIAVQEFNKFLAERNDVKSIIIPNLSGNGFDGMALVVMK